MPRLYTVSFTAQAVTGAVDLFEIVPATNVPIEIHGLFLGQTTDVGDAEDENLGFQIITDYTTTGSGGAAPTPRPGDPRDAAASFTAKTLNTTVATGGTPITVHADVWNVRAGLPLWWTPEARIRADAGDTRLVVRQTAPADSITMSGTLYVAEI